MQMNLKRTHARRRGIWWSGVAALSVAVAASAQQPPAAGPIKRTEVLKQVLPPGNFRNVEAAVIEIAPGAVAARHRHDVAVMAYVLEGTVENQFGGGPTLTHKTGEGWWEAPGTVHDVARNPSRTDRARLLIVYIGEEGKPNTVPLN
jgi:quercetin dioxygenase-like cupin family protein